MNAPRAWYGAREAHWSGVATGLERTARTLSAWRLVSFLGGAALLAWGGRHGSMPIIGAGIAGWVAFGVFVARHARILDALAAAEAGRTFALRGAARLARDWTQLPPVAPPALDLDGHPYARDLDLFGRASVAQWLGSAATTGGTHVLGRMLLDPSSPADVAERQAGVRELAGDPEWRERLHVQGFVQPDDPAALRTFAQWARERQRVVPAWLRPVVVLLTAAIWILLALQVAGIMASPWWLAPLVPGVVLSFAFAPRMYRAFDRASAGDRTLRRYAEMFGLVEAAPRQAAVLARARDTALSKGAASSAMRQAATIIQWSELRRAAALLHFPVQALTLWDFHVAFALDRWRRRHASALDAWFDALGLVDAISVFAAVAFDHPDWCLPHVADGLETLEAEGLAHPLLPPDRAVPNDVRVGPRGTVLLVTGSNMSGKSTLLRAIGLNAVLAQAGAPVCANALAMPPLRIYTSIRVQDSLELGLSYFMAALSRLKLIVDAASSGEAAGNGAQLSRTRLLYLLDEVLQGTNSAERAIAVRGVARHLLAANAIGVMTTHDLALAADEPFATAAVLVHFTEQVHEDGTMTFDYRLRPGLAASRNALRLMQLIGLRP